MRVDIFTPGPAATKTLSANTTSSRVALHGVGNGATVRVTNNGGDVAFIEFGDSTVAATVAASMPILPGSAEMFSVPGAFTHVAAITAAGTAPLYFTTGQGS